MPSLPTTAVSNPAQQDRVNLYNQLNQQPTPVVPTPGTTTNTTGGQTLGTNGNYDYQTAIKARMDAINGVGTSTLNRVQAQNKPQFLGAGGKEVPISFKGQPGNAERNNIVNYAEQFKGMWYKWGGSNPSTSFDCSGLVQYVYKKFGLSLPRISAQQAMVGRRTSIQNLKPGDLVAWDDSSRNVGADHIAIYIGNGQIMEAPHTGAQLRIRSLGNDSFDRSAWGVSLSQYLG